MSLQAKYIDKFRVTFDKLASKVPENEDNNKLQELFALYGHLLSRIEERGFETRKRGPASTTSLDGNVTTASYVLAKPPKTLVGYSLDITHAHIRLDYGDIDYFEMLARHSNEVGVPWVLVGNRSYVRFNISAGGCYHGERLERTLANDGPDQCISRAIAILSGRDPVWGRFGEGLKPKRGNPYYWR